MNKELLELIRERLLKIKDFESEIDILEYFMCIQDFSRKVGYYKWISSKLPVEYHNLTISDFISLSDKELSKIVGKGIHSVRKYRECCKDALSHKYSVWGFQERADNQIRILKNLNLDNYTELFANCVLKYMKQGDKFFDAGIALFYDDEEVKMAVKKYGVRGN